MLFSDKKIIETIKHNREQMEECFAFLYTNIFPKVLNYFIKKGASEELVKDLFQDSIIDFYEAVKEDRYEYRAKISTYIFTLVNNRWINNINRLKRTEELKQNIRNFSLKMEEEHFLIVEERKNIVYKYMDMLKEDCRKILTYFYFHKLSMDEIAEKMGYKNEQISRNKKLRCLKVLQSMILKN